MFKLYVHCCLDAHSTSTLKASPSSLHIELSPRWQQLLANSYRSQIQYFLNITIYLVILDVELGTTFVVAYCNSHTMSMRLLGFHDEALTGCGYGFGMWVTSKDYSSFCAHCVSVLPVVLLCRICSRVQVFGSLSNLKARSR
jgi:hypothetical protein